jgi:hypothetical protein
MYVYVDRDVSRTLERVKILRAMKETQGRWQYHVNVCIESVISLEQYEDSKKLI